MLAEFFKTFVPVHRLYPAWILLGERASVGSSPPLVAAGASILPGRIPRAGERDVPAAIAGIEEGLDCLTEGFARNRHAEPAVSWSRLAVGDGTSRCPRH